MDGCTSIQVPSKVLSYSEKGERMNITFADDMKIPFVQHWRAWKPLKAGEIDVMPGTRADVPGRTMAVHVPPAFVEYLRSRGFALQVSNPDSVAKEFLK